MTDRVKGNAVLHGRVRDRLQPRLQVFTQQQVLDGLGAGIGTEQAHRRLPDRQRLGPIQHGGGDEQRSILGGSVRVAEERHQVATPGPELVNDPGQRIGIVVARFSGVGDRLGQTGMGDGHLYADPDGMRHRRRSLQ